MMKKRLIGIIGIIVIFVLVSSIFVAAQDIEREECGFWCKMGNFLFGSGEEKKALAGKAGGIWGREKALVGKALLDEGAFCLWLEIADDEECREEYRKYSENPETFAVPRPEEAPKEAPVKPKPTAQEIYEAADKEATALEAEAKKLNEKAEEARKEYNRRYNEIDDAIKHYGGLDGYGTYAGMRRQTGENDEAFRKRIEERELKDLKAEKDNAEKAAAKAKKEAKEKRKEVSLARWGGSFWRDLEDTEIKDWLLEGKNPLGYVGGGILSAATSLGKYRALSNIIMPEITQEWFDITNSAFFGWMDAVGAVTKEYCDYDEKMTADIPGQNAIFIETAGESYQFVGRIQAERSSSPTYILCHPEEKTCPSDFVCKDDLCYENEDAEEPVKGYLYKIEWGVTAPKDEKFTPFIDENGKAVKFNVMIRYKNKDVWLYKREGAIRKEVMELENGEPDGGMWLRYLGREATEACIKFSDVYYPVDRYEKHEIKEICTSIEPITRGEVEFGRTTSSQKVSTGEVTEVTDIW